LILFRLCRKTATKNHRRIIFAAKNPFDISGLSAAIRGVALISFTFASNAAAQPQIAA
jgi:hypothetical protein